MSDEDPRWDAWGNSDRDSAWERGRLAGIQEALDLAHRKAAGYGLDAVNYPEWRAMHLLIDDIEDLLR